MLDYANWLQQAVEFAKGLERLPGKVDLEIDVSPPLTEEEFGALAQSCRLPIPEPLRRFWTTVSRHCHINYLWHEIPAEFTHQLEIVFADKSVKAISGGPGLHPASETVGFIRDFVDYGPQFRDDQYPIDARYWENSLPIAFVGNGDHTILGRIASIRAPSP